jgi:glyoxylase-like metal-dependent hydrolase (beta-lactamase superfamily II)
MKNFAGEITQISASLHLWQLYNASVKSDLFSIAIGTDRKISVVDPVPVRDEILQGFLRGRTITAIFVTNANHCRASLEFSEKFNAPIFAHKSTCAACDFPSACEVKDGETFATNLSAVEIEGAVAGEMAIYHAEDGGALIIGDALINFEPYGFTFLPPKYCSDAKKMRRSLQRLLDYQFERMLFAHGLPLMHSARKKLEALLHDSN